MTDNLPATGEAVAENNGYVGMIQLAIEKNLPIETLERLFALQTQHEDRKAAQAFALDMAACQQDLVTVGVDRKNSHTGSMYATLQAVNETIRPVYSRHGFSLSFNQEDCPEPKSIRVVCELRHEGGHVQRFRGDFPLDDAGVKGTMNKTPIQALGSTITYARRYLTLMALNVTAGDEDTDGNAPDPCITPEECLALERRLIDLKLDRPGFAKWLGAESLDLIKGSKLKQGLDYLSGKEAEAKKTAEMARTATPAVTSVLSNWTADSAEWKDAVDLNNAMIPWQALGDEDREAVRTVFRKRALALGCTFDNQNNLWVKK